MPGLNPLTGRARSTRAVAAVHRDERGQVLYMFVAGLVVFLGLVGLSVDVGMMVFTRTDLQKAADAAAFAASQDLPNTGAAQTTAEDYVALNAGADASTVVTFKQVGISVDTVTVETGKRVDFHFLRVLGMDGTDVDAKATVQVASYAGGNGLVPFGLVASNDSNSSLLQNSCFKGWENGEPTFKQNMACTMKYGAGTNSGGDFGALSLDNSGGSQYRDNIGKGSSTVYRRNDKVPSETGNMNGPTRQGIDDRLALPRPSGCQTDVKTEVLEYSTNAAGETVVSVREECKHHPRIILIPVVDKINNPQLSTILGFAFMWLESTSNQGGQATVIGEFVQFVTEIPGGVYEGNNGGSTIVKLLE
jgi:Flp pilus assembly protein TadG